MNIVVDDLSSPQIAAFLTGHVQQMRSITPAEYAFALNLDELRKPDVTFWTAWDDSTLVGCAALKRLDDAGHVELKSMRTATDRLRSGIASRLLEHIIAEARRMGVRQISLETGTDEFFAPARRLYAKFGFTPCPAFGDYQPSEHNTFMTLSLTTTPEQ
jgi:putative acetyltransferase